MLFQKKDKSLFAVANGHAIELSSVPDEVFSSGMLGQDMYRRDFQGNDPDGRDRFVEVVDRYGLKVRNKTRKPKTTDSSHGLPTYPNIIKDFIPSKANQLWVSDITFFFWISFVRGEFFPIFGHTVQHVGILVL